MDKERLFDALDGLFAYDSGCTDSGIHDDCLKAEVRSFLEAELEKPENEHRLYPKIVDEFMAARYFSPDGMAQGYGLEDAVDFAKWLDDELGLG